jgi:hypothetical protein
MEITSTVFKRLPERFDMCGQVVSRPIQVTGENISHGLIKRLYKYALNELIGWGFECCAAWDVEVYTLDADEPPANRFYSVKFMNSKGGSIEVNGILTNHGWPNLNHSFSINRE